MIKIELETPVILVKQIPELVEKLGLTKHEIFGLINGTNFVTPEAINGIAEGTILTQQACDEAKINDAELLTGTTALKFLWDAKYDDEFPCVKEVNIPVSVFYEGEQQWMDISYLVAQVASWNNRVSFLAKADAPLVILRNERRILTNLVNMLEDTSWCKHLPTSPSGHVRRCLADVDYSLLTGWSQNMLDEFEKRKAEVKAEMDAMQKAM